MFLPKQQIITKGTTETYIQVGQGKRIIALGIQGPQETKFWINENPNSIKDNTERDKVAIRIGNTGIYELDLSNGFGLITQVFVQPQQEDDIIVDYLYEIENNEGVTV